MHQISTFSGVQSGFHAFCNATGEQLRLTFTKKIANRLANLREFSLNTTRCF